MIKALFTLFTVFAKIGFIGFGGGYAMLSLIVNELDKLGISLLQFADLNALDMIVPGPIMINAATYVGFLNAGFWGALVSTVAVTVPSFVYVSLVMRFIVKYRNNTMTEDILSGIKPAAVGLIAAAALTIGVAVIFPDGDVSALISSPLTVATVLPAGIFLAAALANIRFKVNPILLTVIAGIIGAILL